MNVPVVTIAMQTLTALTPMVPSHVLVMMDILEMEHHVPMSMNAQITNMIATQMPAVPTVMVPSHALVTTDMKATELPARTKMNATIAHIIVAKMVLAQTTMVHSLVLVILDSLEMERHAKISTSVWRTMVQTPISVKQLWTCVPEISFAKTLPDLTSASGRATLDGTRWTSPCAKTLMNVRQQITDAETSQHAQTTTVRSLVRALLATQKSKELAPTMTNVKPTMAPDRVIQTPPVTTCRVLTTVLATLDIPAMETAVQISTNVMRICVEEILIVQTQMGHSLVLVIRVTKTPTQTEIVLT
jgi:hypothetical protein